MNISILFKTPKQTTKYSIHRFTHSFQIDSTSVLFLEQGLRTVDVYVCVLKPQVSPADRVLCCCQWELAIISYPLSGCLQSQETDKHLENWKMFMKNKLYVFLFFVFFILLSYAGQENVYCVFLLHCLFSMFFFYVHDF